MADNLSTRQKVAMAAALGAGVVVGAGGIMVYQRLSQVRRLQGSIFLLKFDSFSPTYILD